MKITRQSIYQAFEQIAVKLDPWILRFLDKSQPFLEKASRGLMRAWLLLTASLSFIWKVFTYPVRAAARASGAIFGTFEYRPSPPVRSILSIKQEGIQFVESRVKVIQKRILNAREARPPVFRTAVMMSAAFALVLGGCSSFQLFKKLTRTNATVSGPEYVKPSDETSPSS
ncbi:MAG TPA: hypothetical protein PLD60_10735, partial [Leptospiraceae bacterium]|nr:hypothetical protein [Leptospiraceae bacterium]